MDAPGTSSATPSEPEDSDESSALAVPAGQILSNGVRMGAACRTAPPKQIADALMRAMLGNHAQVVLPPAVLPQAVLPPAVSALVIPSGSTPVPVAPPQTTDPLPGAAAPTVPANPQLPGSLQPAQTLATVPDFEPQTNSPQNGAWVTAGNVSVTWVNPGSQPVLSGLAFGVNLTLINPPPVAAPQGAAPAVTAVVQSTGEPSVPADPRLATSPIPDATAPPATPATDANVMPPTTPLRQDNASPKSDWQPVTTKLETATQPKANSEAQSDHASASVPLPEQMPGVRAKAQPVVVPLETDDEPQSGRVIGAPLAASVTGPTATQPGTSLQAAPVATPQPQQPGLSGANLDATQSNAVDTKSRSAAGDASGDRDDSSNDTPAKDTNDTTAGPVVASAKAAPDPGVDLGRVVDTQTSVNPPGAQDASRTLETPYHAAADAIRNAEPVQPDAPLRATGSVQELVVRISQPDTPAVDVHVLDRAGQIQVAVRTPDASMQSSLREDLGTLVNSLGRAGYRAETFTPQQSAVLKAAASDASSQEDRDRGESHSGNSGGGSGSSSDRHPQQKQRDQRSNAWFEELEKQA
jgi:hypothetical protein